ncbi:hypothetical protein GO730_06930 [Spirosoma sp. HMF3257]|nr:hypothetical protein [Spirosoma telluris]
MKIRIIVTTDITKTDLVNAGAWLLLLALITLFGYGASQLYFRTLWL